jgi:hypothetical protein
VLAALAGLCTLAYWLLQRFHSWLDLKDEEDRMRAEIELVPSAEDGDEYGDNHNPIMARASDSPASQAQDGGGGDFGAPSVVVTDADGHIVVDHSDSDPEAEDGDEAAAAEGVGDGEEEGAQRDDDEPPPAPMITKIISNEVERQAVYDTEVGDGYSQSLVMVTVGAPKPSNPNCTTTFHR